MTPPIRTDHTRWLEALSHPAREKQKDDEKIYESWGELAINPCPCAYVPTFNLCPCPLDCPQVQAVYDYVAQQPDELGLTRGDVVKVYRKMADGKNQHLSTI